VLLPLTTARGELKAHWTVMVNQTWLAVGHWFGEKYEKIAWPTCGSILLQYQVIAFFLFEHSRVLVGS